MTSVTVGKEGRRIGLLGGTFDPPHIGHVRAAVRARHDLDLDVVLVIPAGDPWQKRGDRTISPAPVRMEMVRAATAGIDGLVADDIEVRRPGPSYAVDTVAALRAAEPDATYTLILGSDAAALLPTWERPDELLARVRVAVVPRPGTPGPAVAPGVEAVVVEVEQLEVSSSVLRADVAAGRPIDGLVAPGVVAVIRRHGLYRR